MLDKVKKLMLKQYDSALKTNGYWTDIVWDDYFLHRDSHTHYADLIKAQTPPRSPPSSRSSSQVPTR